jgi:hypothetical protein
MSTGLPLALTAVAALGLKRRVVPGINTKDNL